jgi:hypothetical protein
MSSTVTLKQNSIPHTSASRDLALETILVRTCELSLVYSLGTFRATKGVSLMTVP